MTLFFAVLIAFFPNSAWLVSATDGSETDEVVDEPSVNEQTDASADEEATSEDSDASSETDADEEVISEENETETDDDSTTSEEESTEENDTEVTEDREASEDEEMDLRDVIGTASGDITFDHSNGYYTLDGYFSIANFSKDDLSEPWLAFALPADVSLAAELPSGVELVTLGDENFIAVKLENSDSLTHRSRSVDIHLTGEGAEVNPNYTMFLAEYTDAGFIFHGELQGQREIDFDAMTGTPEYNLEGNLTGSTSFDADERYYTLHINGDVTNNEAVDIEDVYVSFVVPEDIKVLESDVDSYLLEGEDGSTELAVKLDNLEQNSTTSINVNIPIIGKSDTVVTANEINLYKIDENVGYWPLTTIDGSIEMDFTAMNQAWTFEAVAQIVKDFPDVAENQFGLQFAFDTQNLTIDEVNEVVVQFNVPDNLTIHAPDEYTSGGDIPDALEDFLESGSSGNLDIEWDGNVATINLDDVQGTQWNQGYFTAIGESTEPIESLEGLEVIVQLFQDESELVEELTIPFEIVPYENDSEDPTPDPTPVDKADLESAVEEAEALDAEDYTDETYAAVAEALENATSVLADEDATQEDVDEALAALEQAIENLETAEKEDPEKENPEKEDPEKEDPNENEKDEENDNGEESDDGNGENGEGSDDQIEPEGDEKDEDTPDKDSTDEDESDTEGDDEEDGDELPETATDMYTLMLIGSTMAIIGGVLLFLRRRKQYT